MNVGDEYLGLDHEIGSCEIPICGLKARPSGSCSRCLPEDWYYSTGEQLVDPALFPVPSCCGGRGVAQAFSGGPDGPANRFTPRCFSWPSMKPANRSHWPPRTLPNGTLLMALGDRSQSRCESPADARREVGLSVDGLVRPQLLRLAAACGCGDLRVSGRDSALQDIDDRRQLVVRRVSELRLTAVCT